MPLGKAEPVCVCLQDRCPTRLHEGHLSMCVKQKGVKGFTRATLEPLRVRNLVSPLFSPSHFCLFFLPPAKQNTFMVSHRNPFVSTPPPFLHVCPQIKLRESNTVPAGLTDDVVKSYFALIIFHSTVIHSAHIINIARRCVYDMVDEPH